MTPSSPLRVLLVEDNPVNQMLARRLLEKNGHQVVVAANGKEALAVLDVHPFDLVLMDLEMPEMDGLAATAAIRAGEQGSGRRLPIIALTAQDGSDDRQAALAAGMDAYLTKPVHGPRLLQALSEAVAQDGTRA
jgi:two-component system, sensor histidine kinase and response regulator